MTFQLIWSKDAKVIQDFQISSHPLCFSTAQFDRLGESELYRVDGAEGRLDDMTGRTIDTDDLYDQEERKVDLADQEVTFRTDQAIVAGMYKITVNINQFL